MASISMDSAPIDSAPLRTSALMLIGAGLLFGGFMFFHPTNNPQGALESIWVPVHFAWFLSYVLLACSFLPLYSLITSQGVLATVAYWVAFLGTIMSLPIAVWDSFVIPYLAKHAPDFIQQIEEISTEPSVLTFRIIVFLTVFLFSLGFILYGLSVIHNRRSPLIAGLGMVIGAPLFWIGAFGFSQGPLGNRVTEVGAFLFGLGLVMLGIALWSHAVPLSAASTTHPSANH